jgi:hypothetical protein
VERIHSGKGGSGLGRHGLKRKYHSSKQAAGKALADSINSSDLANELARTICESFILEIIKACAIERCARTYTALEEWILGRMSPMRR